MRQRITRSFAAFIFKEVNRQAVEKSDIRRKSQKQTGVLIALCLER